MLKGRHLFKSGHVKIIKHQQRGDNHFFKCHVIASYTFDTKYNVTLIQQKETGKVLEASCDCKASAMRQCNNVAALLFSKILLYIMEIQLHLHKPVMHMEFRKKHINVIQRNVQVLHTARN
jgi:hypothetical protein